MKSESNESIFFEFFSRSFLVVPFKRKLFRTGSEPSDIVEAHKRLKTAQLVEIMDELNEMQKGIDVLKRKIIDFIQHPDPPIFPKYL